MVVCPICQDTVSIPVLINVFPCYDKNKIHCFTFTRVCLTCALQYLYLKSSRESRPSSVKCLYCPATCNPQTLSLSNHVQFDYFLPRVSPHLVPVHCPFCFEYTSSIISHLSECKYMYVECECGYVTFRQLLKYHTHHCPHYRSCKVCAQIIHERDYFHHLLLEHDHMECEYCHDYFHFREIVNHKANDCPYRKIHCRFCSKNIPFNEFKEHLEVHEKKLYSNIDNLKSMITNVEKMLEYIREEKSSHFHIIALPDSQETFQPFTFPENENSLQLLSLPENEENNIS